MYHLQLANTEFEGRNSIYLLGADDSDAPTTLVDAGVATDAAYESLAAALGEHGVSIADLDQILLTHWHDDHAGIAGDLQAESGATVYAHPADAPLIEQRDGDAHAALRARQQEYLERWGMPEDERETIMDILNRQRRIRGQGADVTPVEDGDIISVGDLDLTVVHLPGHAKGLVGYVCERNGRRECFVGDAILPKYTPNVGGADVRVERPLAKYLDSLQRIQELDLDRAWPGHRGPIFAPGKRACDIEGHHADRTDRVLSVIRERGPSTAWEVSAALFGDLHSIHILHGPGEAYAHLDHLVHEGQLEEHDGKYTIVETAETDD